MLVQYCTYTLHWEHSNTKYVISLLMCTQFLPMHAIQLSRLVSHMFLICVMLLNMLNHGNKGYVYVSLHAVLQWLCFGP